MKSLENIWHPAGSHRRRARPMWRGLDHAQPTREQWRRRLLRECVASQKLKASSAFARRSSASRRLKMMLERKQDLRRSGHADVSASEEMLVAAYWDTAGRTVRTRPTLNDPCSGSKRLGFARAEGRAGSAMGAPWAMKMVVFLRNGACQGHAGRKSNLRSRVRSRDIELGVSEIASLSSIACCSLLSANSARKGMGGARAEAAVLATMWPANRRAPNHIHAPHPSLTDRRHFLREMMAERCA
ncbi:hypothetical protein XH93_08410 [Bradyrhizobium sp. CCBAU 51753]|nr:hypothetical protein XH93_08410 [Bradyrhizobium sp. CCBAU 51753]